LSLWFQQRRRTFLGFPVAPFLAQTSSAKRVEASAKPRSPSATSIGAKQREVFRLIVFPVTINVLDALCAIGVSSFDSDHANGSRAWNCSMRSINFNGTGSPNENRIVL